MDKVGGFLRIQRTTEFLEIVIARSFLKSDARGVGSIVLKPRQARNLASPLVMHAEEVEEADMCGWQALMATKSR